MVPYGTSLYACPPRTPGYHPSHSPRSSHLGGDCKRANCQHCRGTTPRGPVYRAVDPLYDKGRLRRNKHGRSEADVNIREYDDEEDRRSTDLGEVSETKRMGRKEGKMKGMRRQVMEDQGLRDQEARMSGGRRGVPGPYDVDPRVYGVDQRPTSALAGYAGLRGGQGHLGMEDMAMGGMPYPSMHPSMHPGAPYPMPYPGFSPHGSIPPQYASHESMGYPPGIGGLQAAHPYASASPRPPRPPPPSTSSPSPSPNPVSKKLSPSLQAAIEAAVQKSAEMGSKSRTKPTRSKTSPTTFVNGKHVHVSSDGWGDGINTCICTTNCKCRKGERATGWYEGIVENTEGEEVPVRGKLNTRWVLADDLGKDCGHHTTRRKSASSSGSDTETSRSMQGNKHKNKNKKNAKKDRVERLEDLESKIDKMEEEAALRRGSSPFAGQGYDLDPNMLEHIEGLRTMKMTDDTHGMDRVGGMGATERTQGTYDPMTTRNKRGPRMPPKIDGMRMRFGDDGNSDGYEYSGGASPGNPYARPKTLSGKGRYGHPFRSKPHASFGIRGGTSVTESESTLSARKSIHKNSRQARNGKLRPHFGLDDTDISLGPRRYTGIRRKHSSEESAAEMYSSPSKSCTVGVIGVLLAETFVDHDSGGKNEVLRSGRPRIGPQERRGGARHGRTAGRQPCAETDDEESY